MRREVELDPVESHLGLIDGVLSSFGKRRAEEGVFQRGMVDSWNFRGGGPSSIISILFPRRGSAFVEWRIQGRLDRHLVGKQACDMRLQKLSLTTSMGIFSGCPVLLSRDGGSDNGGEEAYNTVWYTASTSRPGARQPRPHGTTDGQSNSLNPNPPVAWKPLPPPGSSKEVPT